LIFVNPLLWVKAGVADPDFEGETVGGWQGRVVETDLLKGKQLLTIQWDSITLKAMKEDYIVKCEQQGLEYFEMNLLASEFEKAEARDKTKDVERVQAELDQKYMWTYFAEQGKRIEKVLQNITNEHKQFEAWEGYLFQKLTFPFKAIIAEANEVFTNQLGKKVEVKDFDVIDDLRGIIVNLGGLKGPFQYPLCDLEVIDKSTVNYEAVEDYATWFANR